MFKINDKVRVTTIDRYGEVCAIVAGGGVMVRVELDGRQNAIHVSKHSLELIDAPLGIGDRVDSRLGYGRFTITAYERRTGRYIVESVENTWKGRKRYAYLPEELKRVCD